MCSLSSDRLGIRGRDMSGEPFGGDEVAVKNKCGVALDVLSNAAVTNNEKLS